MVNNEKIRANVNKFVWQKKGMVYLADNGTVWLLHDHHRYMDPMRNAVKVKVGECEKSMVGVWYDY